MVEAFADVDARVVRWKPGVSSRIWWLWGMAYDRRFQIQTTDKYTQPSADDERNGYEGFVPWYLRSALAPSDVLPTDVFVDVGSGKGRVLFYVARHYPFWRVIGVESEPALHQVAEDNLRHLRGAHRPIELVNEDAVDWQLPDDATHVFLYNAFVGSVFTGFMRDIRRSLDEHPRRFSFIYANPQLHEEVLAAGFELERQVGRIRVYRYAGRA